MATNKMIANVIFTENVSKESMSYNTEIEFSSIRGMKVSLKNCINRNIHNLQRIFGYCKSYKVEVIMNGKVIASTTLAA